MTDDLPAQSTGDVLFTETLVSDRGFWYGYFKDNHGQLCRLSKSSSMEGDYIWLGLNPHCMHLSQEKVAALLPYLQRFVDTGSPVPWPVKGEQP